MNSEPLNNVIYQYLLEKINAGEYNDTRLPTEMELAQQFYVSRITSKLALNKLAENGIITRIPGKGSFVKKNFDSIMAYAKSSEGCKTIALIMSNYSQSFGIDILTGALKQANKANLNIILKSTESSQILEGTIINDLLKSGIAGIIVQPAHRGLYSVEILKAVLDGVPIVSIDRRMNGINTPYVGTNNAHLSKLCTDKLLKLNHRSIAFLSLRDEKTSVIADRASGFFAAYEENRLFVDRSLFIYNFLSEEISSLKLCNEKSIFKEMVKKITRFLFENPHVTAVFGTEDTIAQAAYDAAISMGKRVPQDISIVGFDTGYIPSVNNTISGVKQAQLEMGHKAVELLEQVMNKNTPSQLVYELPGMWVEGSTIAIAK